MTHAESCCNFTQLPRAGETQHVKCKLINEWTFIMLKRRLFILISSNYIGATNLATFCANLNLHDLRAAHNCSRDKKLINAVVGLNLIFFAAQFNLMTFLQFFYVCTYMSRVKAGRTF